VATAPAASAAWGRSAIEPSPQTVISGRHQATVADVDRERDHSGGRRRTGARRHLRDVVRGPIHRPGGLRRPGGAVGVRRVDRPGASRPADAERLGRRRARGDPRGRPRLPRGDGDRRRAGRGDGRAPVRRVRRQADRPRGATRHRRAGARCGRRRYRERGARRPRRREDPAVLSGAQRHRPQRPRGGRTDRLLAADGLPAAQHAPAGRAHRQPDRNRPRRGPLRDLRDGHRAGHRRTRRLHCHEEA